MAHDDTGRRSAHNSAATGVSSASSPSSAGSSRNVYASGDDICTICGLSSCPLVSHRLTRLEISRRISRSLAGKQKAIPKRARSGSSVTTPSTHKDLTVESSVEALLARVEDINLSGYGYPSIFGADDSSLQLLREFFVEQSQSVLEPQREMCFDQDDYHPLLSLVADNSAFAISFVAMAATFNAIHTEKLARPSQALNATYSQAFESLHNLIEIESPQFASDTTIATVVNLCLCHGIAFCNTTDAQLHWNGVLALLEKPRTTPIAGSVLSLIDQTELWLILIADLSPRNDVWHNPVPHCEPPPEKYGRYLNIIQPWLGSNDTDLLERIPMMCNTVCRATETLEARASRDPGLKRVSYDTYFQHLRSVAIKQSGSIYAKVKKSGTFAECLALSACIFLLMVLRRTPWKAPVQRLCTELRRSISQYASFESRQQPRDGVSLDQRQVEDARDTSESSDCSNEANEMIHPHTPDEPLPHTSRIWVLIICAIAARWCSDDSIVAWTRRELKPVYAKYLRSGGNDWKVSLKKLLAGYIWSDVFLSRDLQALCTSA